MIYTKMIDPVAMLILLRQKYNNHLQYISDSKELTIKQNEINISMQGACGALMEVIVELEKKHLRDFKQQQIESI